MKYVFTAFVNCFQNLLRNKLINLLSLSIIVFTLLIFSVFNFITWGIDSFARRFSDNIEAIFYLQAETSQEEADHLYRHIQKSILVKDIRFKSREQAAVSFSREFPQLEFILSEFDASPFPASIHTIFKSTGSDTVSRQQVMDFIEEIGSHAQVESRQVNLEWVNRLNSLKKFISTVGIFLSVILIFISLFIIYNVIKINILYRRDEIDILKLVGATDFYIRFPFIIEGGFLGFIGSMLSLLFLFLILGLFPRISPTVSGILQNILPSAAPPLRILLKVVVLGTTIGFISSFLAIRHFMKD